MIRDPNTVPSEGNLLTPLRVDKISITSKEDRKGRLKFGAITILQRETKID